MASHAPQMWPVTIGRDLRRDLRRDSDAPQLWPVTLGRHLRRNLLERGELPERGAEYLPDTGSPSEGGTKQPFRQFVQIIGNGLNQTVANSTSIGRGGASIQARAKILEAITTLHTPLSRRREVESACSILKAKHPRASNRHQCGQLHWGET